MAAIYKILLLGESGAGKSTILARFLQNTIKRNLGATKSIICKSASVKVGNNTVNFTIWDAPGKLGLDALQHEMYRISDGAIFVFDASSRESFEKVKDWMAALSQVNENFVGILVANVTDKKRRVSIEEGQILADQGGMSYIECNAMMGDGVQSIFETAGFHISEKVAKLHSKSTSTKIDVPVESDSRSMLVPKGIIRTTVVEAQGSKSGSTVQDHYITSVPSFIAMGAPTRQTDTVESGGLSSRTGWLRSVLQKGYGDRLPEHQLGDVVKFYEKCLFDARCPDRTKMKSATVGPDGVEKSNLVRFLHDKPSHSGDGTSSKPPPAKKRRRMNFDKNIVIRTYTKADGTLHDGTKTKKLQPPWTFVGFVRETLGKKKR